MSKNIDSIILERWNAYLDNELGVGERAEFEAALAGSPDNRAFIAGQEAFDAALKASFAETRGATLPTAVHDKMRAFLNESALPPQATSALRVLKGGTSVRRIAVAALVLITISILGTLVATGQFQDPKATTPPVSEIKVLPMDEVLVASMKMMDTTNITNQELVDATYASMGVDSERAAELQAYGCGMSPISVRTVKAEDGTTFTQLCYCTCDSIAETGPNKGEPIRKRFVLNIIKGNMIPSDAKLDAMGCKTEHATGYHSFSKYHKESDSTYIIIVPACFDNEDAEKMVMPLLV